MSDKRDDIVNRLQTLGHPASEFLPDGKRLTLLIQCSHEAADEIERLRAELAAYNEQLSAIHVERANLRAELAAERRRADNLSRDFDRDIRSYQAERDALRALLREARDWIDMGDEVLAMNLVRRIDAAIKGFEK